MKMARLHFYNTGRFRKVFFRIFIILFPLLFFLLLEISLRLFNYGIDFELFVNHPDTAFAKYKIINPEIGARYFQNNDYSRPKNDMFTREKGGNTVRIFVMGSSTVAGFPFESNLMFSRILQERLRESYPGREFEVINTALTAINSYTLNDITDDILDEKPDAILLYAGHNEYYGAFGPGSKEGIGGSDALIRLHLWLMDLRFYQLLRNALGSLSQKKNSSEKSGTLMSRIVKNTCIPYGGEIYEQGIEQYKRNINNILKKAERKGVKVFIGTLVSNIADLPPLDSEQSERSDALSIYMLGKQALQSGEDDSAYQLLNQARDMDCIRFRASSSLNKVIRELAVQYNATLVPVLEEFEKESPGKAVGKNLLTEHVHPNISGYFLMADVFYRSLVSSGICGEETDPYTTRSASTFHKSYGYTELDSLIGNHLIENLRHHWPFVSETQAGSDYRVIYKPSGFLDSVAFTVVSKANVSSVDPHLTMVNYYKMRNEAVKAYREYKAITAIAPYTPDLLREAAGFFIDCNDLSLALKYFRRSLEFEESYYACFRAGEISLLRNDYNQAAHFFTRAFKSTVPEYRKTILVKLFQSYVYSGKTSEAEQVLKAIKSLDPEFSATVPARTYFLAKYIPVDVRDYVEKARLLIDQKRDNEALEVLLTAHEINHTPVLSYLIARGYYRISDWAEAEFYLRKAYPWFRFDATFLSFAVQVKTAAGKKEEADDYLKQLLKLDPSFVAKPTQ